MLQLSIAILIGIGFEIDLEFVVGFGLDYDQKITNLNAIYKLGELVR